ncbi:MAG: single-stranded DNA-binding protein [Thermoprotei archaeon]|nr:MAG: single-stranded DNA-binding protein [Thermoprotei archaeon]
MKVRDLRPSSRWFTVTVKVLDVGEEKTVFSRRDRSRHRVAEALVGDETGTILFSLWDEDIDRVREMVGSSITVRNGYIVLFRGSMRLALGRFGTIEEPVREIENVNESVNMSEKRYEMRRSPPRRFGGRRGY